MKIYDVKDSDGRVLAFEIGNTLLGRQGALRVVRRIPGALITRRPRRFSWLAEEDFCTFDLDGVRFTISEPFGDNSRYWIGPTPIRWVPHFNKYEILSLKLGFGGFEST